MYHYKDDDGSHCILCGCTDGINGHHVLPRCNGGEDGPLATLCAVCHDGVHRLAYAPDVFGGASIDEFQDYAADWDKPSIIQRAAYLAAVIYRSFQATANDPNRKVKYSGTMTAAISRKLKELTSTRLLGTNQEDVIFACIERAYTQLIGEIKQEKGNEKYKRK